MHKDYLGMIGDVHVTRLVDPRFEPPPHTPLHVTGSSDDPEDLHHIDTYPDGTDAVTLAIEPPGTIDRCYRMPIDEAQELVWSLQASIDAARASDEDDTFTERILDQRDRWEAKRTASAS